MSYSDQPIGALLKGPLLTTPQGHVVLISFLSYLVLVAFFAVGLLAPPLGKSIGSVVVTCLAWPFIVFLMFVKHGLPSFRPSSSGTLFLAAAALMPIAYVIWKA